MIEEYDFTDDVGRDVKTRDIKPGMAAIDSLGTTYFVISVSPSNKRNIYELFVYVLKGLGDINLRVFYYTADESFFLKEEKLL